MDEERSYPGLGKTLPRCCCEAREHVLVLAHQHRHVVDFIVDRGTEGAVQGGGMCLWVQRRFVSQSVIQLCRPMFDTDGERHSTVM